MLAATAPSLYSRYATFFDTLAFDDVLFADSHAAAIRRYADAYAAVIQRLFADVMPKKRQLQAATLLRCLMLACCLRYALPC